MKRRSRFVVTLGAMFVLPSLAIAQAPASAIAPPIPTGPPLLAPPMEIQQQTWVENANVMPAGGIQRMPGNIGAADAIWPGTPIRTGSACNFDGDNGSNGIFPNPSSVQVLMGGYFSSTLGPTIPMFNYLPVSIRQIWSLGSLNNNMSMPANWDFVVDVTGAGITKTFGDWFAGASFMFRYNWTEPGSFLVPYTQVGVGGIYNDAYKVQFQHAIGESFEFYLHAEVGIKCFVMPNLSLDIEGGLQHISNAGLASRNLGVNAVGGTVGFTYYFGGAGN